MDSELTDQQTNINKAIALALADFYQQTNINKAIALALADFYSTKTPPKKPDVTTIIAEIKKSPLDEEHYMNVSVDNPNNQTTDEFINELINGNDKSLKIYESKYEKSPMIPAPPTPAITSTLALASV